MEPRSTRAFGLEVESEVPLPGFANHPGGPGHVVLKHVGGAGSSLPWSGTGNESEWQGTIDDRPVELFHGVAGDHMLRFGQDATVLDRGVSRIECTGDAADPRWQRFVLDTVLWTASLLRGFEMLHASSVFTTAGVVSLVAPSGFGKTSLALELMRRGHTFFTDDILALEHDGTRLVCHPGPPLMNVPRGHAGDAFGQTIATLGAEAWIEVDDAEGRPSRPAAVFVLELGRPGSAATLQPSPLRLLPHSLGFRHLPGRQRTRFEVFAELAATTPVFALPGAMQARPSTLADEVERALAHLAACEQLAGVGG